MATQMMSQGVSMIGQLPQQMMQPMQTLTQPLQQVTQIFSQMGSSFGSDKAPDRPHRSQPRVESPACGRVGRKFGGGSGSCGVASRNGRDVDAQPVDVKPGGTVDDAFRGGAGRCCGGFGRCRPSAGGRWWRGPDGRDGPARQERREQARIEGAVPAAHG